jgi:AcrR family transcriptional regulator
MALAKASREAVVTHWMLPIEVPNSRPSVGKATLTMVASSTVHDRAQHHDHRQRQDLARQHRQPLPSGARPRVVSLWSPRTYSRSKFSASRQCAAIIELMTADLGLRERKKLRTRQLLSETARRLFSERGFEQVSIAEIAREAELSEQTVFNYFPRKEDLVYSGLEAFEDRLLTAIRERPPDQTVIAAFGDFILEARGFLATDDEAAARELMAVTRMIAASPALLAREQQIFARYTNTLAQLIAAETGARAGDQRPLVVANALIGVHRALIAYVRERLDSGATDRRRLARDVRQRGENALSLLSHGLGDYAPQHQKNER